jgi:hypothetical protein
LIQAGNKIKEIDHSFPDQVFNHVIVSVPIVSDTIYLECTSKNCPTGYMGTFTQGREALVVDKKSYFVQIPRLQHEKSISSINAEINLKENPSIVEIKMNQKGYLYDRYSVISNDWSNADKENYMQYVFPNTYQLETFTIKNPDLTLPEINISATLKMQNIIKTYGKDVFVNSFARSLPDFESPENRTQALQLDYPIAYSDTIRYAFSEDLAIKPTSQQEEVNSNYGICNIHYDFSENFLTVTKQMFIFGGKYEIEEYPSFYEFFSAMKNNEKRSIHLELKDE